MESPLLQYRKDRAMDYPSIEEQLDMIWHELNTNGSLSSTYVDEQGSTYLGVWFNSLNHVKDKHPKPDELTAPEE